MIALLVHVNQLNLIVNWNSIITMIIII